jgi:hypothetical protein
MATAVRPQTTTLPDVNGAAMAAILSSGIGAFAMAFFVILNEAGLFTAPTLYGPAGGDRSDYFRDGCLAGAAESIMREGLDSD